MAHRHALYLGEIDDSQREAWQRSIRVFAEVSGQSHQLALFPADRLPPDGAVAAQDDTLYHCLDLLLPHKEELFGHLRARWSDLFGARFEVLLYDPTSTYFECAVPADEDDPRRFGYSRDKRGD